MLYSVWVASGTTKAESRSSSRMRFCAVVKTVAVNEPVRVALDVEPEKEAVGIADETFVQTSQPGGP